MARLHPQLVLARSRPLPLAANGQYSRAVLLASVALACLTSCGLWEDPTDNNSAGPAEVGQMELMLDNPAGVKLVQVDWVLRGANGTVFAAGGVPVDPLTGAVSLALTLPVSVGDVLAMSATNADGVRCAGESAPFNVLSGQISNVGINLICGTNATPNTMTPPGQVVVSATLVQGDNCPVLNTWTITPSAGSSPTAFNVDVIASDADPGERLSFTWTADAGVFTSPGLAHTQYVCAAAGSKTLHLMLSDNHLPVQCTLKVEFPAVSCP